MDKKQIAGLANLNKTTKAIFNELRSKQRKPKDNILDLHHLKGRLRKNRVVVDAEDFNDLWGALERGGAGQFLPAENRGDHPRFELYVDITDLVEAALGNPVSPKQAHYNHKNPSSSSTAGPVFQIATDITKVLHRLSAEEVEFLVNLLNSRYQ